MTTRIYVLAKDLKVESKVLTELCQKLGIKEKANSLTILTADDAAQIKAYLAKHPQKTDVDFTVSVAPVPPGGSIPDLAQKSKSSPKQKAAAKSKASDSVLLNLTDEDVVKIKARVKRFFSKNEGRFSMRIYSLAKELGIESKVLCDLCQQLGIKCHGGSLTNLSSDDVAKIKAYFEQ